MMHVTLDDLAALREMPDYERPCEEGLVLAETWLASRGGRVALTPDVVSDAFACGVDAEWLLQRVDLAYDQVLWLVGSPNHRLRIAAACRTDLAPHLVETLSHDAHGGVRGALLAIHGIYVVQEAAR
jgi:hypothetical protein